MASTQLLDSTAWLLDGDTEEGVGNRAHGASGVSVLGGDGRWEQRSIRRGRWVDLLAIIRIVFAVATPVLSSYVATIASGHKYKYCRL